MKKTLENILENLKGFLNVFQEWGEIIIYFLLAISVLVISFYLFSKIRKKILFNSWINRFDQDDKELGKSIGDLLLFKLRFIKRTHQISSYKISLWNTFEDIPSFRQSLGKEMDLLASVKLGNYGKIVAGILTFLFKLVPLFIKPAALNGSINKYGEKRTIFQISLDNYNPKKWFKFENLLWEKEEPNLTKEQIPDIIEEMAYKIYIDLTGGDLFKSWECFKHFTMGLRSYLNYTELKRTSDLKEAEKHYNKALEFEKNNPVVTYNLGVLKYYQYKNDLNDEAISLFGMAMNCTDINLRARALCGLANAYAQKHGRFKTGKPNSFETLLDAIEYGEKAVLLNDKLDSAFKALAYANHQYGEALATLSNNSKSVVEDPNHRANKHRIFAEKCYKKAIQLNKEHFIAQNNLANMYLEWATTLEQSKSSKSIFVIWILNFKKLFNQKFIINRAYLLKKAIDHCEEALKINPSYHFAHDNLGNAYYENENYIKARNSFRNALLYMPTYAEAMNDLAMIYLVHDFDGHDISKAKSWHKEALDLLDKNKEKKRIEKLKNVFNKRMKTLNTSEGEN